MKGFERARDARMKKDPENFDIEACMVETLIDVGPTSFLTSLIDFVAFMLAAITKMPAVRAFSIQVAVAVLFEVLLVLTAFVSLLVLDAKRVENERVDLFPCTKLAGANNRHNCCYEKPTPTMKGIIDSGGVVEYFLQEYYVPFLLHKVTRIVVIIAAAGINNLSFKEIQLMSENKSKHCLHSGCTAH